jgi:hypothetical protein
MVATAVRRAAVLPVPVPVPSYPARAATNWKEYGHDDDRADTLGHRV